MHWLSFKFGGAAVIQFTLDPIQAFLFCEPFGRQRSPTEGASASSQELQHRQRVVALLAFDSQPRTDAR
jgi:hypothetical protein